LNYQTKFLLDSRYVLWQEETLSTKLNINVMHCEANGLLGKIYASSFVDTLFKVHFLVTLCTSIFRIKNSVSWPPITCRSQKAVGIAQGLATGRRTLCSILSKERFIFSEIFRPVPCCIQPFIEQVTAFFPGLKHSGREFNHTLPFSIEVNP